MLAQGFGRRRGEGADVLTRQRLPRMTGFCTCTPCCPSVGQTATLQSGGALTRTIPSLCGTRLHALLSQPDILRHVLPPPPPRSAQEPPWPRTIPRHHGTFRTVVLLSTGFAQCNDSGSARRHWMCVAGGIVDHRTRSERTSAAGRAVRQSRASPTGVDGAQARAGVRSRPFLACRQHYQAAHDRLDRCIAL